MTNIWVTSDTHFNHENIIRYCDRPFRDVHEMNEALIERWNSVVKDGDKVYHLGDVYMSRDIQSIFPRLKGSKRLILGNHDNGKDQQLQKFFKKIEVWRMFPEFGLLLTHVPVHWGTLKEGMINVHGHTHQNGEPIDHKNRYKCVCVELTDYTPVNIEDLRVK